KRILLSSGGDHGKRRRKGHPKPRFNIYVRAKVTRRQKVTIRAAGMHKPSPCFTNTFVDFERHEV
ncbi:MAG: hypothetical protein LBD23_09095, partial [Oscillospiraceae bacterium]|nr:hypothetical protein [Oscillospiraceae bacterium]